MITYSVVFSIYFRVEIESYPAFLFSGLIPWLWFASSLQDGTPAVVQGANLIGRSRFDPELLPAVTILGGLAHCVLSLPLVLAFAWLVGRPIGWGVLLVPVLLLLQLLLTIGPVTILSAWNVYFRDVQQFVPTAVQILFLSTPILYPASIVPEGLRMVVALNPWYHLASAYQDVLYYGRLPGPWGLLFVALAGLVLHAGCEWAFAHYRERLAEEL
jgi:ABC-type polysaccharide/polyol phosphate export permease